MEKSVRHTANYRAEFARECYTKILLSFNITDSGKFLESIAGYNARKLAQAYRVYTHYLFVFNGSRPGGTAIYNRNKFKKTKKK